MNKKISLGLAVTFMVVIATVTFCITMLFSQRVFNNMISDSSQRENILNRVREIDKILRNNFLFPVDDEAVADAVSTGFLHGLDDAYADYMSKQQYERYLLQNKGELVGIGIQVRRDASSGYLLVTEVYPDTPAELAGMKPGDAIVKIDDQNISSMEQNQAVDLMQGKIGTRVMLSVQRNGVEMSFEMQRKSIEIPSIKAKSVGSYTYIRIMTFNNATPAQFKQAVDEAQKNGTTGFVFDVRDNSGGTLDSVIQILDYLLPKGVIASQENAKGEISVIAESDANHEVNLPMVTIANGRTASAAELFVAALKDYEKANLVGTQTYGKGVMQTTYALSDGSAIRFTTAFFHPPKSQNFNGVGLKPDYEVMLSPEQEKNLEFLDEQTDIQLIKALDVLSPQTETESQAEEAQAAS